MTRVVLILKGADPKAAGLTWVFVRGARRLHGRVLIRALKLVRPELIPWPAWVLN